MTRSIPGLHHVTAICGPAQDNVDFFVRTLRQRLVKRTVNFDDPGTYHLYYGDHGGSPGTIMTYFPFADAGPGRAGPGMASAVAYAVPLGGVTAWMEALAEAGTDFEGPFERFGERAIALQDPDGLRVELIESQAAGTSEAGGPATDGFHSVTLWVNEPDATARLLTELFAYREVASQGDGGAQRLRFASPSDGRGAIVDVVQSSAPTIPRPGAGTVHHVAYRAESAEVQREWRERVQSFGLSVTPVIDRQYFEAIYFREPNGILFEIATDPPGFAIDEPLESLGRALKLPPQYEERRATIERRLPPLRLPA